MVTIHNHTFRVKYYQNYPEVNTMKGRILTETQIAAFAVYLKSEEKSENTIENLHLFLHGFVLLGASCLRVNVAVIEFFYKFAHIFSSFDFLP